MSTKLYSCLIYEKKEKSTSELISYLDAYKSHLYPKPQPPHKLLQQKSYDIEDALGRNQEDKGDLFDKTITITTVNSIFQMPTEDISQKKLFVSESLLALKKEWFSSHKFFASTSISKKKYKYPRSKYKNSFYFFNNQLSYDLAYYFAESETTKGNMNKFLIDLLMASFTKKLLYKNADKLLKKLSEILFDISDDKQIEYRFAIENNVSRIVGQEIII